VTRSETRGAKEAGNKRFENSAFKEQIKAAHKAWDHRGARFGTNDGHDVRCRFHWARHRSIRSGDCALLIRGSPTASDSSQLATAPDVGRTLDSCTRSAPRMDAHVSGAVAKRPGTWRDRRRIFTPAKEPSKPPDRVNSFRSRSGPSVGGGGTAAPWRHRD
jgi:hypothetical protein